MNDGSLAFFALKVHDSDSQSFGPCLDNVTLDGDEFSNDAGFDVHHVHFGCHVDQADLNFGCITKAIQFCLANVAVIVVVVNAIRIGWSCGRKTVIVALSPQGENRKTHGRANAGQGSLWMMIQEAFKRRALIRDCIGLALMQEMVELVDELVIVQGDHASSFP